MLIPLSKNLDLEYFSKSSLIYVSFRIKIGVLYLEFTKCIKKKIISINSHFLTGYARSISNH